MSKDTEFFGRGKAKKSKPTKPAKPYPGFPLFPHATGRWAKKIRGKTRYFGPWRDTDGALAQYLDQRDDLYAGREPRAPGDERPTIGLLCNAFCTAKKRLFQAGEITARTLKDYVDSCQRVVDAFGKGRAIEDLAPADFDAFRAALSKTRGPVALANEIGRIRVVFRFALDHDLLQRPARFGQSFRKPSAKTLRLDRAKKGPRVFSAAEIHQLLALARPNIKAMILLAINAGLGNHDVGGLRWCHVDTRTGWLDYPRPKTGMPRRAFLWKATIKAIRDSVDGAPVKQMPGDPVFHTRKGHAWAKATRANPLSREFANLLKAAGIARPGLGFYALRHTFETVAGASRDQVAVDAVMGHAPRAGDMSAVYREGIDDDRLKAIANHVRKWLGKT